MKLHLVVGKRYKSVLEKALNSALFPIHLMKLWNQLDVDQVHKSYALVGLFSTIFCLVSLIMKEKVFIGEAIVSTFIGTIFGPHVANIVNPNNWAENSDYVTREISRLVLIIQIFAISVELPRKFMKFNYRSVITILLFTMILGWIITGVFAYVIFPGFTLADGLAITGSITATDPVLAAAIVGKGKFSERIPAHIRHLISAESGANDGLAFPFVILGANLLIHSHHAGIITKNFILTAVLYECVFGIILGIIIGYSGRKAIQYCETRNFIDKESFLIFYILLSLICTGFGSILGVDDLLVSFSAGGAFAWNGWFASKVEGQYLSNAIDLLLNVAYFLYFGAIIPWNDFNNKELGLEIWRLILFGIVIIFLRRIPAVLLSKPFVPALKDWREALFVGHFGPIGVGGIFCSIITKDYIIKSAGLESSKEINETSPYFNVLRKIWPIVSFLVVTSILIHGFSVTFIVLYSKVGSANISKKIEADTQNDKDVTKDSIQLLERINVPDRKLDNDHEEGSSSSILHSRKVLLGKLESEELKFYKIGHEVIVETMDEKFIKKYKVESSSDEELAQQLKFVPILTSEMASSFNEKDIVDSIGKFLQNI